MTEHIPIAGPWVSDLEARYVAQAARDAWYRGAGTFVRRFEQSFAGYIGVRHAIAVPHCTSALHLALLALGIGPGDEVIVPECTWIASAAPITYLRAKPVLCDIDPMNWCLDPESVRRNITSQTKAILVVDLFGNMPLMNELIAISEEHGIPLIEDSAESLGSTYSGIKAGKFGVGSVFSFHRTKTVVTGEGGLLLLDDDQLFERCMVLRDHGRKPGGPMYYNFEVTYK